MLNAKKDTRISDLLDELKRLQILYGNLPVLWASVSSGEERWWGLELRVKEKDHRKVLIVNA